MNEFLGALIFIAAILALFYLVATGVIPLSALIVAIAVLGVIGLGVMLHGD